MWLKLSGRSFTYIKKSSGPNIAPWGTPANIGTHFGCWLVITNLNCPLLRILSNSFNNFPGKPEVPKKDLHAMLYRVFEISRKFPLLANELAKFHLEKFTNVNASDVVKFLCYETLGFWKLWLGTSLRGMAIAFELLSGFFDVSHNYHSHREWKQPLKFASALDSSTGFCKAANGHFLFDSTIAREMFYWMYKQTYYLFFSKQNILKMS